tara:strand:- start:17653 stop:19980 length:2328 start_codon:yes stop_codon:yes gene_type:complete
MSNVMSFDLEVENHIYNKRLAGPFDERNYIVQIGYSINGGQPQEKYYNEWHRENVLPDLSDIDVLVGFNTKFDLLWVWKEPELIKFLKKGGTIYCGQLAEYLMGGMQQEVQMCSMNQIAESYGGGCKIDAVKEMWEDGYKTSEIPQNLLTDYLIGDGKVIVGDVHNTWLIYKGQIKRMLQEHPKEFRTMMKFRMDGLLATTEMEYNGMYVDAVKGAEMREGLVTELAAAQKELEQFIPELPPELVFNWNSPLQKSCLIFGGTAKYEKWVQHTDGNGNGLYAQKKEAWPLFTCNGFTEPVDPHSGEVILAGKLYVMPIPEGTEGAFKHKDRWYLAQNKFKGGKNAGHGKFKQVSVPDYDKPKGAKKDHYFTFDGYVKPKPQWKGDSTDAYDEPLYSTAADVIDDLKHLGLPFTDALSKQTSIAKDLGTYYWSVDKQGKKKGMLVLVETETGLIHHKLNHTSTVTSRLSSSDPNLQTLPRGNTSDVKKMFVTRFVGGMLAEIDYSQLEIVVQGVLTNDPQLRQDLKDGIDFHIMRLCEKLPDYTYSQLWDMHHVQGVGWVAVERTGSKNFSFLRAYGGGVAAIMLQTGLSKQDVEILIKAEETRFPGIVKFDKRLESHIDGTAKACGKLFIDGVMFNQKAAHWDSPTGTRYMWKQEIAPKFLQDKGKYTSFSPTTRKNYPVQGFGGEIVQTMLGKVFRYFVANDMFNGDVLLINTVHDCVLLDGRDGILQTVAKEVQTILEDVPNTFNNAYEKLNIDVPFPCETEIGKDLFHMTTLH